MNSIIKKMVLLLFVFSGFLTYSQSQQLTKSAETGLFASVGSSLEFGKNASKYSKNKLNSMIELGGYKKTLLPSNKYSYKFEYSARFINTPIKISDNVTGIANQNIQSLNFKFGKNFTGLKDYTVELYLGTGIYTLAQKRIPDTAFSNQKLINDGLGAYWGVNAEFEISASVPLSKGKMGFATRLFIQPPITIASKSDVPKYYNQGFLISWFFAFGE